MKKLLNILLMLIMFVACSDDTKEIKEIVLDKGTATNQTIYSDETSTKEGISFTATEEWTATVTDISTRAAEGRVDWLELSRYDGGAGKFTLGITIEKNDTGSDRKAEIKIVCGETTITVVVEQKAITSDEAGTDPNRPQSKKKVKTIKEYAEDNTLMTQTDVSYDNKGRIVKLNETDFEFDTNNTTYLTYITSFTYKKQDNGNLMIEVKTSDDMFYFFEYLYCDNTGKVVRAKEKDTNIPQGTPDDEHEYEYDNQDQLFRTKSKEYYNGPDPIHNTSDFIWSNRNIISYKSMEYGDGEITYSNIKNDANIDLAYLVCFRNSTELLWHPHGVDYGSICGYFGKRVANMPATVKGAYLTCEGNTEVENYTFEYKRDAEGYIIEVNKTYDFYKGSGEHKYVIEYTD